MIRYSIPSAVLSLSVALSLALSGCSPHSETGGSQSPAASASSSAVAAGAAEVPAQTIASGATVLDCKAPVARGATAKGLLAAYRDDAQLGTIPGAEGSESQGLLLYDKVPAKKLEISFWDSSMLHVSSITPGEKAVAWTGPQGIHVGSTLDYIEKVNGKPFSISGFGWDYGGYAVDFKGGRLAKLTGGCTLSLRFDGPDGAMPEGISGDGVTINSDDARLKTWAPKVSELSLGWPLPPGVKPAQ